MKQIIPQNLVQLHVSWQKELANVVTDPKILLEMLQIDPQIYQDNFPARKLFPVRVPKPFIKKMALGDIHDPLLQQVMPLKEEFNHIDAYSSDPLEEHDTVAEGLLHKYSNRVLMIVKAGCAVNCRYCFRRHFPYADNSPNKVRWQPALNYIAAHNEIDEVIFSGGDPLMASDNHIAWLINEIEAIKHIKRLRIHTRLPVVIPNRVTDEFVNILSNSRLICSIVLHINHANEIDDDLISAIKPLIRNNIRLFNQSVLLKNINDNSVTLAQLSEKLFDNGIQPYYLHVLDKVQGAAHFDINEDEAKEIYKQLMANVSGYLIPRLVREIAGEANKTPLNLR